VTGRGSACDDDRVPLVVQPVQSYVRLATAERLPTEPAIVSAWTTTTRDSLNSMTTTTLTAPDLSFYRRVADEDLTDGEPSSI
jgi:hypothetical protein